MAAYRHRQQHARHQYRYGPRHWVRHLRGTKHLHPVRRRGAQRRRRIALGAVAVLVVLLLAVGALAYRSLSDARSSLEQARMVIASALGNKDELLSAAGRRRAGAEVDQVRADAVAAQHTLHSSSLRLLGHLPILSGQVSGVRTLVADVQTVAQASRQVLGKLDALVGASHGTSVSLPALQDLQRTLLAEHRRLVAADRPAAGLWGALASARARFDQDDQRLVDDLSRGTRTIGYALPFLGADGPRTYLVAGENNAEMRDQGTVLSLAVLRAASGRFHVDTTGSVDNFLLTTPVAVALPPGTAHIFGPLEPTRIWQSTNASADFPLTGQILQAMYAQQLGAHVNGVVALDVPALVSLLKLTGPVVVPGIAEPVSAANAATVLLSQLYQGSAESAPSTLRHDEISAVARTAFDRLTTEHVDLAELGNTLAQDVAGRHLMVWDEVPTYEATLSGLGASGAVDAVAPDRTFHLAVENATATKLDFFTTVAVRMTAQVSRRGSAQVTTVVTVVNHAPAGRPPSLALGPDHVNSFVPGQYVTNLYLWSPMGSVTAGGVPESGLVVNATSMSVLPQRQGSVRFATTIPHAVVNNRLVLRLVPQPRLRPATLTVTVSTPGWRSAGPRIVRVPWDRSVTAAWHHS